MDELSGDRAARTRRSRKLGEFKPTNAPLSKADLDHRRDAAEKEQNQEWVPRATENIDELTPVPDGPVEKRLPNEEKGL